MNFRKKHLENIVNANNNNRLAIFIGAGISKCSESAAVKLPTWNDIIKDLKSDLGLLNEENDFLKIAQLYFLEFKEFTYYEKLKSYFPSNIEPSLVHKLIFDTNPQCIITTNWDTILEKTIENNAYIYDVVSSDEDLVKSTLQKKLIKMHGDFKNHNIVFKEDDYLSYQHNFPLIENYIKSILSTHTVLFLGYSYNDVNLKHIMKWLQNHSSVSPPMYLISFKLNSTQEKYLENHGITVLVLNDGDGKYNHLNEYSRKIATFLDILVNPSKIYSKQNDDEIVDYIYGKLEILNNLDSILLEQIQNTLTNCGFRYGDDDLIILEFYSLTLTTDLDEEVRVIHNKFVDILKRYNEGKYKHTNIEKIFNILIKANISGIVIPDDTNIKYIDLRKIISFPVLQDIVEVCFNFNFSDSFEKTNDIHQMVELAYQYYLMENYANAYNILEEVIVLCLKQRNYTQLFLSMFNRNLLLRRLKISLADRNRNKYQGIREYDLKEKFNNLPKDLNNALEPIYFFVNFDYLYTYAFRVTSELKKKEEEKRTIQERGLVFNRNITESSSKHKNLVLFLLQNKIMIDDYIEYKTIIKYFVEIAIIRQVQNEYTWLNKIVLYSCIRYISNNELKLIFKEFYANDSDKKTNLKISDKDIDWLIEKVLPNLVNLFIESNNIFSNYEKYLKNVIFLLSLISIDKKQIEKLMTIFLSIISEAKTTIGIYESVNHFLGIQYNLFKTKINDEVLIKLIEAIIHKLVYKKYKGFDYNAITCNLISNLYGYARENNAIFNNKELVSRLLLELKNLDIRKKIDISESLLLNIYDISNDVIQKDIKDFILHIDTQHEDNTGKYLTFELLLVVRKFKEFDDNIIYKIDQYMKQFEDGNRFSSILYTFKSLFDYLVNKMLYEQFKDVLEKTNRAIENYESRNRISIF